MCLTFVQRLYNCILSSEASFTGSSRRIETPFIVLTSSTPNITQLVRLPLYVHSTSTFIVYFKYMYGRLRKKLCEFHTRLRDRFVKLVSQISVANYARIRAKPGGYTYSTYVGSAEAIKKPIRKAGSRSHVLPENETWLKSAAFRVLTSPSPPPPLPLRTYKQLYTCVLPDFYVVKLSC